MAGVVVLWDSVGEIVVWVTGIVTAVVMVMARATVLATVAVVCCGDGFVPRFPPRHSGHGRGPVRLAWVQGPPSPFTTSHMLFVRPPNPETGIDLLLVPDEGRDLSGGYVLYLHVSIITCFSFSFVLLREKDPNLPVLL